MKYCQIIARMNNDLIYSFNHYSESRTFGLCLEENRFLDILNIIGNITPLRRVGEDYYLKSGESVREIYKRERWLGANNYVAPYGYGIVFIDFKNKKLFSYNDYSDFSTLFGPNIYLDQIINQRNRAKILDLNETNFFNDKYMEKKFQITDLNTLLNSKEINEYSDDEIYELKLDIFYQKIFLENLIYLKNKYQFEDLNGKIWDLKNRDVFSWIEKEFNDVIIRENGEKINIFSLPLEFHKFKLINSGWDFYSGNSKENSILKEYMINEKLLEKNDLLCW